jgi:hypothetical protein
MQRRGTNRSPLTTPLDAAMLFDSLIAIAAVGVTKASRLWERLTAEETMTDVR